MTAADLYHYTCDHGHAGIGEKGHLLPISALVPEQKLSTLPQWSQRLNDIIWLTNLSEPMRDALGLTMRSTPCDRTRHRYRVYGYRPTRYTDVRRDLPKRLRDEIESAPGAMPMHWWIAYTPVPVLYDPVIEPARQGGLW